MTKFSQMIQMPPRIVFVGWVLRPWTVLEAARLPPWWAAFWPCWLLVVTLLIRLVFIGRTSSCNWLFRWVSKISADDWWSWLHDWETSCLWGETKWFRERNSVWERLVTYLALDPAFHSACNPCIRWVDLPWPTFLLTWFQLLSPSGAFSLVLWASEIGRCFLGTLWGMGKHLATWRNSLYVLRLRPSESRWHINIHMHIHAVTHTHVCICVYIIYNIYIYILYILL